MTLNNESHSVENEVGTKPMVSDSKAIWIAALAALTLAISLVFGKTILAGVQEYLAGSNSTTSSSSFAKILILDTSRIIDAAANTASSAPDATTEQMFTKAQSLTNQIKSEISTLTAQGYIILKRDGVLAIPAGVDITQSLADKFNIDLSKSNIQRGNFELAR